MSTFLRHLSADKKL